MIKYPDSILFDLDGTLWDAVEAVTEIWNKGIENDPAVKAPLTQEDVRSIMGLNTKEIGAKLFPYLSEAKQWELMLQCGQAERQLLSKTGGILYPHLEETLGNLSEKCPLFVVSNCDEGYIEAFLTYHKLEKYFTDHLCYGDTGLDKPHNIRRIVETYHLKQPIYVGDTEKDQTSAQSAEVDFIYAAYGYGSIENAPDTINDLRELNNLFLP